MGMEDITHLIDSNIHHVEYCINLPEDEDEVRSYLTIIRLARMANTSMISMFQPSFVPRFSRLVVRYKTPRIPSTRFNLLLETLFHSTTSITRIHTVFDLVVRWMDTTLLVTSLKTLTLNICKASFDSHTFRIPDPHKTFLVVPRSWYRTAKQSWRAAFLRCIRLCWIEPRRQDSTYFYCSAKCCCRFGDGVSSLWCCYSSCSPAQ
jgi:hypothetical protein